MLEHGLSSSAVVVETHALFGAEVAAIPNNFVCFRETQLALSLTSFQFLWNRRARRCDINVAYPPCDAAKITQLPDLPWKHFLNN
ncbi:LOW QUALITY PROTEIN: hypothetical protein PHMEG_00018559 [Phytophthora megakarya]|uniref:Uncharacterized protein n=1 Tax=Phytophthora megakarya TaxID=4795 RepID=A0A225VWB8_9STRA|nr:LOW QUALITY PROTEIN: hypothetical protein PHMEG_00018559 [Phytophthora megakarya]